MRLLILTEVSSIHAARWINQMADTDWTVHVFQVSYPAGGIHPELNFGTVYYPGLSGKTGSVEVVNTLPAEGRWIRFFSRRSPFRWVLGVLHKRKLKKLLRRNKYDVIHSHGMNINWNNLLEPIDAALKKLGDTCLSPWLYSTWGSDLDFFPTTSPEREESVRNILPHCDFLTTECERDRRLAGEFGFRGRHLGILPDFGGVARELIDGATSGLRPSDRKLILMKGRDILDGDPVGRAMNIMAAIGTSRESLKGFTIAVFQASETVTGEALVLRVMYGLNIVCLPYLSYSNLLRLTAAARVYVSMTANDGLPSALVEAMALGAFPIQSNLESIAEYVQSGKNGILVPVDDVGRLALAIKEAVTNDDLVDRAAEINLAYIKENLSDDVVRPKVIEMYRRVAEAPREERQRFRSMESVVR